VLIYYAGHGGIIEDVVEEGKDGAKHLSAKSKPWRYQFLVPIDYRENTKLDSNGNHTSGGILDFEVAGLLNETTERTRNVTTIFDCCHAGHIARDPVHAEAVRRQVRQVPFAAVSKYIDSITDEGVLRTGPRLDPDGNQFAVRVAASADTESAWEYQGFDGKMVGSMTQALCKVMNEALAEGSEPVTWRTMLQRVRELVKVDFPQQSPHAEGPDERFIFSLVQAQTHAIRMQIHEDVGIIHAGRVSGVRENNVYDLMPLGSQQLNDEKKLGTATVTPVIGLESSAKLSMLPGKVLRSGDVVLAFPVQEAVHEWPVDCPEGLNELNVLIGESKFLRVNDEKRDNNSLMRFLLNGQDVVLVTGQGVRLASQPIIDGSLSSPSKLIKSAEQLAKAQHLASLTCNSAAEKLDHKVSVVFGTVKHGESDRIVEHDGSGSVTDQDHIFISLTNDGPQTVHVSAFDISVTGKISLLNKAFGSGIELPPRRNHVIGSNPRMGLRGCGVFWPQDVPKTHPVSERLVLVLTNAPTDLRFLATPAVDLKYRGDSASSLERLAFRLATGPIRDIEEDDYEEPIRYDTLHIPFTLKPLASEKVST
jgi:hypothetical protein